MSYPEAFSSGANYYRRNGLYAQNDDDIVQMMRSSVAEAMADSGYARLKCADSETYDKAVETLFDEDNGVIFDVLRRAYSQAGGDWSTSKYAVIKNDELYTITIILYKNE